MRSPLRRASQVQLLAEFPAWTADWSGGAGRRCLVVDADRTLSHSDTGRLVGRTLGVDEQIRRIFEEFGYEELSFSLVAATWGGLGADEYLRVVGAVAEAVVPHAAWLDTLAAVAGRCPVVVVTAGIPQAWRLVLDRHGHGHVPVVGGCHPALDSYLVCPETKADIVRIFKAAGWTVAAAGDSPIDLQMLKACDFPLFVPDHKGSPGLSARLHEVPNIRRFVLNDDTEDAELTCNAKQLSTFLLYGVADHADRPHPGTTAPAPGRRHT